MKFARAPSKHKIDPSKFSTVLTSCGRFDLLEKTVGSFLNFFDAESILISEDSEKPSEAAAFKAKFPLAEILVNTPKLGHLRSIDRLYSEVSTPYVVHLEDDWLFVTSLDLDAVVEFLEAHPDVAVVCFAHRVYNPKFAPHARNVVHCGIEYLVWDLDAHPKWFSYSFNPSIARTALWREVGPFGRFGTEENLSQFCKARGMRITIVVPSAAHHIGDDRHVQDPFQPPRAKTLSARLKRSVAKRWAQLASRGLDG